MAELRKTRPTFMIRWPPLVWPILKMQALIGLKKHISV